MKVKTFLACLSATLLLASCGNKVDSSSTKVEDSSINTQESYTAEGIIKYISYQLLEEEVANYEEDFGYYVAISFGETGQYTISDALAAATSVDIPEEFALKADNEESTFEDGTPVVYSYYESQTVGLEFDSYEEQSQLIVQIVAYDLEA